MPIVRSLPLARPWHGAVELGGEVARAHYRAVVEPIDYGLPLSRRH